MTLTRVSPSVHETCAPPRVLTAVSQPEGTRTAVFLRGEADLAGRSVLDDALSRVIVGAGGDVVVDLADLAFIDCGSLQALVTAEQFLRPQDRALTVRSPSRLASWMLGLWGASDLIEVRDQTSPGDLMPLDAVTSA